MWWSNNEERKAQKEAIKTIIKRTKLSEKTAQINAMGGETPPGLSHSLPTSATYSDLATCTRAPSEESPYSPHFDFNQPPAPEHFDPYHTHIVSPPFDSDPHLGAFMPAPYEVDVKTERQMFVNNVPTRRDSSISTFSTFQPPQIHQSLPTLPENEEWIHEGIYDAPNDIFTPDQGIDFDAFDFSHGAPQESQQALVQVEDCDKDLLNHFVENVLRLIFPILEVNQHGSARSEVILPALETNKCYLHCCLSVAAMHLKSLQKEPNESLDNDILRHRYATVTELCTALNRDTDHMQILEAALGMIFFQCSVGRPDDSLPDIPWHQHFQAASNLVRKLDMPHAMVHVNSAKMHPPFNMTLATWIDILGATMLGQSPTFAHTYREKREAGSTSGLCELMGCEDRTMYVISEIACLEAISKDPGRLDSMQICTFVEQLGRDLDAMELPVGTLDYAITSSGALRPHQLSRNMSTLFRIAARIYLCMMLPNASMYDVVITNLVSSMAAVLDYIPGGSDGFDRSIVWPLLIAGAHSTSSSLFRQVFADRITRMGDHAEFGSFGRMTRLLQEVWQINDTPLSNGERQNVHWRDVMQQQGWDFLLI